MFEYLVTSKTRRTLLKLLWGEGRVGTIADFTRWADVAFAGAHKELRAMEDAGLVASEWKGGSRVFSRVRNHPLGKVLKSLVNSDSAAPEPVFESKRNTTVKEALAYLGMPVNAAKKKPKRNESLEALVASGCKLATRDASVARALPVFLFEHRDELNVDKLKTESKKRGQKHAMGFFLALTSELSGYAEMKEWAEGFRDRRRKNPTYFFANPTKHTKRVARLKTPEVARSWNLLMNMSMDSFASTFDKFSHAASYAR